MFTRLNACNTSARREAFLWMGRQELRALRIFSAARLTGSCKLFTIGDP
jgi:hypothetical protein